MLKKLQNLHSNQVSLRSLYAKEYDVKLNVLVPPHLSQSGLHFFKVR